MTEEQAIEAAKLSAMGDFDAIGDGDTNHVYVGGWEVVLGRDGDELIPLSTRKVDQ